MADDRRALVHTFLALVRCFVELSTTFLSTGKPFRQRTLSISTFARFGAPTPWPSSPNSSRSSSVVGTKKGSTCKSPPQSSLACVSRRDRYCSVQPDTFRRQARARKLINRSSRNGSSWQCLSRVVKELCWHCIQPGQMQEHEQYTRLAYHWALLYPDELVQDSGEGWF